MTSQGVTILGSTGSVGCSTLDVIARHRDRFHVVALTANKNIQLLAEQCSLFNAAYAVTSDPGMEKVLRQAIRERACSAIVLAGPQALEDVVELVESQYIMAAIVGAAGLGPSLHAARCGKRLLLANKESMVIAGELFARAAREHGAVIIPVDSEHNALFQALPATFNGDLDACGVEQLILTASGGPFLGASLEDMALMTPEQACNHPNWDMGPKISVDSATLMNKGLEIIEAKWLFNARPDQIKVVVHPQSIVHSMVAYLDGSVISQMGMPDMRTPIACALGWPERIEAGVRRLHLPDMSSLEFMEPDLDRFPALKLAFNVLQTGGNSAVIMNAANECAVEAFLNRKIGFTQIAELVDGVMQSASLAPINHLEEVLEFDRVGREIALQLITQTSTVN
ncbi:MAG: 1-deoxy-D-xylulose-5-phosphate reductoisomerase [Lysobacterales bacterium]